MVSFEMFVKAMPPSLSELKVLPSFCFAFKISDDVTASSTQHVLQMLRASEKDLPVHNSFLNSISFRQFFRHVREKSIALNLATLPTYLLDWSRCYLKA